MFGKIIKRLRSIRNVIVLFHVVRYWTILNVVSTRINPGLVRMCGAKVGKRVFIGDGVYIDAHPEAIEIGDNVLISPNVQLLTHKRDLSGFRYDCMYRDMPHIVKPIKLSDNCFIGMGAIVMPGVTIGEGGGVATGALVTKDVPPWTIVAGCPAKPIRVYSRNER